MTSKLTFKKERKKYQWNAPLIWSNSPLLQEEPIRGFEVSDYLEFMERLERSYRDVVLTDMKTLRDPVG